MDKSDSQEQIGFNPILSVSDAVIPQDQLDELESIRILFLIFRNLERRLLSESFYSFFIF